MISLKNLCLNTLEKEVSLADLGLVFPQRYYFRRPILYFSTSIVCKGLCCPESIWDESDEDFYNVFKTVKVSYEGGRFKVVCRKFVLECRCGFDLEYAKEYADYEEAYKEVASFIGSFSAVGIYEEDLLKIIPTKKLVGTDEGLLVEHPGAKEYIKVLPLNFLDEKKTLRS